MSKHVRELEKFEALPPIFRPWQCPSLLYPGNGNQMQLIIRHFDAEFRTFGVLAPIDDDPNDVVVVTGPYCKWLADNSQRLANIGNDEASPTTLASQPAARHRGKRRAVRRPVARTA